MAETTLFQKIVGYLARIPKFLFALLKSKTISYLLSMGVVAALKAIGLNAPFEAVQAVLGGVGASASIEEIAMAVIVALGLAGTAHATGVASESTKQKVAEATSELRGKK